MRTRPDQFVATINRLIDASGDQKKTTSDGLTAAERAKLHGLANIRSIGANLSLSAGGELSALGGGAGGINLYESYGQHTDGAVTQRFFTQEMEDIEYDFMGINEFNIKWEQA